MFLKQRAQLMVALSGEFYHLMRLAVALPRADYPVRVQFERRL